MIKGKEEGETLWTKLTKEKPVRVDQGWPHGITIFSRVNLDLTKFLLAEEFMSMDAPASKGTIVEVGIIRQQSGCIDYLCRIAPDGAKENDTQTILYIETDGEKPLDTKLFTMKAEIYPESSDDWDMWLNPESGIIGSEILTSPDGVEYYRMWGKGSHVLPIEAREEVISDRFGKDTQHNSLKTMMYGRKITKEGSNEEISAEYALVSVVNDEFIEILLGTQITITSGMIAGA